MRRTSHLRLRALQACSLAALALAAAGPAMAGNTIKLDITGAGSGVKTLSITQDATNNSNTITTTGAAGGAQIPIRGKWNSISITQTGAANVLKGAGITGTTGSTTASLALSYDSGASSGGNVHSLVIGGTTAPANATVSATVVNTDLVNGANTITDVLDGTSLAYTLDLDGTNNTVTDTVAATGAVTLNLTLHGGATGASNGNTVTNTITGATSANVTIASYSNGNTITNTSDGSGDKTISITLPSGGANGNTVSNNFTGGTGTQSSSLLVNGTTSRVNFGLVASGATTASSVTLTDVVGAAGAAAKLALSQTGNNASLTLAVNGNGFTMGSSLGVGADTGVLISQASNGAVLNANINAAANGYTYSISQ
jgi:hypothetical protein